MTREVWIFGDSYASENLEFNYSWPVLLKQQYNVKNFALNGSGPDYQLSLFLEKLTDLDTSNVDVIFFVSDVVRFNFKFLESPSQQYIIKHLVNNSNFDNSNKKYKKYKNFIKSFFQNYVYYSTYNETEIIKIILLLKELSKHFNNMLIIPVFDNLKEPLVSFDNTKKLCIIKNKFKDIDLCKFEYNVNHLSQEVHTRVYEKLSYWLDTHKEIFFEKVNL